MKKMHKILLAVFCAGVLLTGIGAGVLITEFSALSYGGKELLGKTDMRTENFDVKFEREKKASVLQAGTIGNRRKY